MRIRLWVAGKMRDGFGLSIAIVYTPKDRTLQITGMVGWLQLAAGISIEET